ncbi:hypothetical protein QVD17_33216 [Tagetes erecta]|uniref:Tubby C-terminal-like domain-containing protein n=1 Tax=Tagetes erecta TaxID=13708 RepID=A0AAD8NL72_TARER|nr:hypothetical protein QVD17_33216 [Tagetes erecta]
MAKVHPETILPIGTSSDKNPIVLTVWKKSLLFGCYGFTVYDSTGNLKFRVDNYSTSGSREIVLMDAFGRTLHTIRRKMLSMVDNFLVYNGEDAVDPRFTVTKHVNVLNSKSLAYVSTSKNWKKRNVRYEIEGSYAHKSCMVYDYTRRQCVADIRRKEAKGGVALGEDVFALVVQPSTDPAMAMTLVIALDQMFDHSRHSFR